MSDSALLALVFTGCCVPALLLALVLRLNEERLVAVTKTWSRWTSPRYQRKRSRVLDRHLFPVALLLIAGILAAGMRGSLLEQQPRRESIPQTDVLDRPDLIASIEINRFIAWFALFPTILGCVATALAWFISCRDARSRATHGIWTPTAAGTLLWYLLGVRFWGAVDNESLPFHGLADALIALVSIEVLRGVVSTLLTVWAHARGNHDHPSAPKKARNTRPHSVSRNARRVVSSPCERTRRAIVTRS